MFYKDLEEEQEREQQEQERGDSTHMREGNINQREYDELAETSREVSSDELNVEVLA